MKLFRSLLVALIIFCSVQSVHAQPFTVKGIVNDTLNANRLQYSSVTLVRAADSILETFTRSGAQGAFELHTNNPGKYIIMITFPSFADYVDIVTVDQAKPVVDMGTIPMVSKSHLLNEFVLKQQIGAIKIKGDTVEYMADSFKVKENATVEELLKKLPGIQVNKNGEVVAQGEKVQKILVDGEEFFTDDPAVVTKSLQAKAVEKVQVFDKKSDEAQFTGIDDGTREKTINLSLKDNMKKGYFGRVNVGGGTDGYFENQGMINAFKAKRKLAVFGIAANTGKIGLGWDDKDKFGGGNNVEFGDDGFTVSGFGGDEDNSFESWNGKFTGQGLPAAWTGGFHYSNKWMEDKLHFGANYRYAKQNIETTSNVLSETNLSDIKLYRDESKTSFSYGERNRGDALYEWKIDSTSQLKVTANGGYSNTRSGSNEFKTNFYLNDTLNDNRVLTTTDATTKTANATLLYQKRFKKEGRSIAFTADEYFRETESAGYLNSLTNFYTPGTHIIDSVLTVDQLKNNKVSSFRVSGKLSYTEPLSKKIFLELNYKTAVSNNTSKRLSFDKDVTEGTYDILNDSTSSNYDFNYLINTGGANLRFVYKKVNFSFGGSMSNTYFSQRDNLGRNYQATRSYNNFFPQASFVYRVPGKQLNFRLNYNGSTKQPSIDQVQPIVQNNDPTRLVIGNENLKQEFNHNVYASYNDYKILSGTYVYMGGGFNIMKDAISKSQTIDAGRITYQYINVDGNYTGWFYGGYGRDIKKLDLRLGGSVNFNTARIINYVNAQKAESNNNSYSVSLQADYTKEKVCDITYRPVVTYNQNTSSINANSTNYWSYEHNLDGSVELPLKFTIGADIKWYIRQQVAQFDNNNNAFLWNAYVAKKFLKNSELEIRASVNDILNQNTGFQRFGSGNTITEQDYNVIKRYGMLSLIWNFTKAPSGTPASGSNIKVRD